MIRFLSIFTLLSLMTNLSVLGQVDSGKVKKPLLDLADIWILTDYSNPNKFKDIWELKNSGIYNELKGSTDSEISDNSLSVDENGSWDLKKDTLIIIISGEYTNGKPHLYDKSTILRFRVTKENKSYKLNLLNDSDIPKMSNTILKLTKKE